MNTMFDNVDPQEAVTSIPFGRASHVLMCMGFTFCIFAVVSRFGTTITVIASISLFALFLMGFRQKCHFYEDRIKFKLTAKQPIVAPYSDIQDITLARKRFKVLLKSGKIIEIDLSLDSQQRVDALRDEFTKKLKQDSRN